MHSGVFFATIEKNPQFLRNTVRYYMKQGRRELNKIQCRNRILKMSRRLFTAKGYEETTMEEVAEAAEVSKATLYNYFASKESLLMGIADAALEEIRQLVDVELADEPDCLIKLRRVLETLAVDSIRYISLTRKIMYLNSFRDSELYVIRQEVQRLLEQLIVRAKEDGQLRRDVPTEELVDMFMGVYVMTQFAWCDISDYSNTYCVERVNRAIDHLLRGLAP